MDDETSPEAEPCPLSFGQERLWFLEKMLPGNADYVEAVAWRLRGHLDVGALERSFSEIVRRHEILRTRYRLGPDGPLQVIDDPRPVPIEITELPWTPAADADDEVAEVDELLRREVAAACGQGFELTTGSALRVRLVRLDAADHLLAVIAPHIACDGWSAAVLAAELGSLYSAIVSAVPSPLAELPIQYGDFALWQREWLSGANLAEHLDYWRSKLSDLAAAEIPVDFMRPALRDAPRKTVVTEIPAELAGRLKQLGRQRGATPFMVFLATLNVLISRYSGSSDVVVGVPIAGRMRPELEDLIGFFVNTLVFRTDLAGDPSFAEILARTADTALEAYQHQELPFEKLVDITPSGRDLSRNPIFQVGFTYLNTPEVALDLAGVRAEPFPVRYGRARFDLELQLSERAGGAIEAEFGYDTRLLRPGTVEHLARAYLRLLSSAADHPGARGRTLDVLSAQDRDLVLTQWSGSEVSPAAAHDQGSVADWFAVQAAATPSATAVTDGTRGLSYAELAARADGLAGRLLELGAGPETVVAVALPRSTDALVALIAVLKTGGAFLPIDLDHPGERIAYMLADSAATIAITKGGPEDHLPGTVTRVTVGEVPRNGAGSGRKARVHPGNLAYVIYTSGSTGRPKAVAVTHGGLTAYLGWARELFLAQDAGGVAGAAVATSLAYDLVITSLLLPLVTGGAVTVVPEPPHSPASAKALLASGRFDLVKLAPSHLRLLTAQADRVGRPRWPVLVLGGEQVTADLVRQLGAGAAGRVINEYGPTEATVGCCVYELPAIPDQDVSASPEAIIPIGRPVPGSRLYVLDDHLSPVPPGALGEIYIGGAQLARGYLNRPGLTAQRFVPDPFGPAGGRLYRTGDLGRWGSDGLLRYAGRADQQVKISGFRVEPGEIEARLAAHPRVRDAVVIGREERPGELRLAAYLVADGEPCDEAEIRDFARAGLPEHMVPAYVDWLDALPITPNGKVDAARLPAPRPRSTRAEAFAAPRDATERLLAEIWRDVLAIDRVGINDRFFNLGGDSIRAVILAGVLADQGLEVSVPDIFQHQTIAGLGAAMKARATAPGQKARSGRESVAPFELIGAEDRQRLHADLEDAYPLGQTQAGMIFELLADPEAHPYHHVTSLYIRDDAPFSAPALRAALSTIFSRHEVLRTSVDLTSFAEALQLVHRAVPAEVQVHDLRPLAAQEQKRQTGALMRAELGRPFTFAVPPLVRVSALLLDDLAWRLMVTDCHAILDGWSSGSLISELMTAYRAARDGRPDSYAAPQTRFADFIALEQEASRSAESEEFWAERISAHERFTWPPGWSGTDPETTAAPEETVPLDDLTERLRDFAASARIPLKSVLLAAHLRLIGLLGGHRRLFTGVVCNGRPETADGDRVYGMFLNTVPFAIDLAAPTWRHLASRVFEAEIELWPHRRYPLAAMQRQHRGLGRLIDVMFHYRDYRDVDAEVISLDRTLQITPAEFSLEVTASSDKLTLTGRPEAVDQAGLARLGRLYRRVLEAMAANPEASPEPFPMSDSERHEVLVAPNQTAAARPVSCLHELFDQQAAATPAATAVVCGADELTYAALRDRADAIAALLRSRGVGQGTHAAVLLRRGLDLPAVLLGVLKAGAAYVPVDPEHPPDRIAYLLRDAGVDAVVTQADLAHLAAGGPEPIVLGPACAGQQAPGASAEGEPDLTPDDVAYVMYTSGSTGRPKGVLIPHRGIANRVLWTIEQHQIGPGDRVLMKTPLIFDAAGWEYLAPLLSGAAVVIAPDGAERDPAAILAEVSKHQVTILQLVPSMLALLAEQPGLRDCTSLRLLFSAGEALPVPLARRVLSEVSAELVNTYGPTECSIDATSWRYKPGQETDGTVPIGEPIANTAAFILNGDMEPVPAGISGELYLGGAGIAYGYLSRPGLTADRFVPDPFSMVGGARLYRTGDRARWRDDRSLEFLGRIDHQVKVAGVRVELGEVEAVLASHPDVAQAVVTAQQAPHGGTRLVAHVVTHLDSQVSAEDLREALAARLPRAMIPGLFLPSRGLPVTRTGKVDRVALAALAAGQPGQSGQSGPSSRSAAPEDPVQRRIAGIWQDVLGRDQIGADDDFFELGGDSLAAIRVVLKLRAEFAAEVSITALLEARTVGRLAPRLLLHGPRDASQDASPIRRVAREGETPLSSGQERLWFLDRLDPGSAEYLVPRAIRLHGALDVAALEGALAEVVARHEILRTRYVMRADGPVQLVDAGAGCAVVHRDLSETAAPGAGDRLAQLLAEESARGMDLERGPVLRAVLARLSASERVLVLTVHHIACDGWSAAVLAEELGLCYGARTGGGPGRLPPLPVQYRDFAVWQREWLKGPVRERELGYWRQKLANLSPVELPADRPRPAVRDPRGAVLGFSMPAGVAEPVLALGPEHGATPFMVLLAAFTVLLSRWAGTSDVVVGTPISGRQRPEIERSIGFFVNTLVLRTDLSGDPCFGEVLARTTVTALEAYAHQDLPFEALVDELKPERDLSRNPLFQIMFEFGQEAAFELPGISTEEIAVGGQVSKVDLTLAVSPQADGSITGELEYAADLFDEATVRRLAGHYVRLLESIAARPALPVSRLDLLTEPERAQLLRDWNPPAEVSADPGDAVDAPTVLGLFAAQVRRSPQAPAVTDGARTLSYAELDLAASRLADALRAAGAGPEVLVVVLLRRGVDAVVTLLAVLKSGAVYVPLDPDHPAERLAVVFADTGAAIAVSRPEDRDLVPPGVTVVGVDAAAGDGSGAAQPITILSDSLAYVIHTSGSTGRPKGVAISHRAYAHHCQVIADEYRIRPDDRVVLLAALIFDVAMDQIAATLVRGATVVAAAPHFWTASELPGQLDALGITIMEITPAYYREVMSHLRPGDGRLERLRLMNVGSDVVSYDDVRLWADAGLPGRFIANYGPTEATVTCLLHSVSAGELARAHQDSAVPIGRPVPGTRACVLDGSGGLVPAGVPGELHLAGIRLARGYLGRPGRTAEQFVPNPFGPPGDRLYRTGDLVRRRPDGVIEFLGRIDAQVKVRGYRIELGDVEAALASHPDVRASAVIAWGKGRSGRELAAYVVPRADALTTVRDLRLYLRGRLPDYMIPVHWTVLSELPLTPSRKVDRAALPAPDEGGSRAEYVAPDDPVEQRIAEIWQEVLGSDGIGTQDDFFQLGGHSLLASRVHARVCAEFGIELSLRVLFQATVLAELAQAVRSAVEAEIDSLTDEEIAALLEGE